MRAQVSRAHLNARRAQRHGGAHASGIGNAAGGDHRQAHGGHDLRQQSEGAELFGQVLAQKVAAVAAGLPALGNDGVGAVLLKP